MNIKDLIAEVRQLDASATPAPWRLYSGGGYASIGVTRPCEVIEKRPGSMHPYWDQKAGRELGYGNSVQPWMNDFALIAHYRTAAPLLAAEVERLQADNAMIGDANVCLVERAEKAEQENAALRAEVDRLTATNEELRLTLAAEQGRAEGAPSERWRYGYTNQGHAWVLPYLDADLPAEHRGRDWTGSSTDHDPICRTYRLFNGKWALWWRLGRQEPTVHDTARAAMLAAKEGA